MDTHDPAALTPDVVRLLAYDLARRYIDIVSPDDLETDPTTQLDALIATVTDDIGGPPDLAGVIAEGVRNALAQRRPN